jgi:hypothetical protein
MGRKTSIRRRSGHKEVKMVGELLIIPQGKPGELPGDNLTYSELLSDKEREALVKRLLQILRQDFFD